MEQLMGEKEKQNKKQQKHATNVTTQEWTKKTHATYGTHAWVHLTDLRTTYTLIKPRSMELYLPINNYIFL